MTELKIPLDAEAEIPRCPDCFHPLSEHENGRCSHMILDHGYNRDYICGCDAVPAE